MYHGSLMSLLHFFLDLKQKYLNNPVSSSLTVFSNSIVIQITNTKSYLNKLNIDKALKPRKLPNPR